MRRFELGLAPLLARLGYTRPDENPLQSAEEVQPVLIVSAPVFAAASPGGRVCQISIGITSAEVIATGAGRFAMAVFSPPSEGAWVREVRARTYGGSFVKVQTSNQITPPALIAAGGFERNFRADNREPYPTVFGPNVGTAAVNTPRNRMGATYREGPILPFWWMGTDLWIICDSPDEGMSATIEFETPLEGVRR